MRRRYLLGATTEKEIVFGEFEVTNRNGYPEFTASFDTVRPFAKDSYDLVEYYEGFVEDMDKAYLYDLCERLDCSPSELPQELADECYDIRDAIDCSLYPEIIEVDGEEYCFESGSCGQHDTREEMEVYTNREAYDLLHKLWDENHLHKVDENIIAKVQELDEMLSVIDEEEWIANYIRENF